ncbi:MAG: class B sortase [Ruminococcus sp.]|nr:class B sortase [Ruminococcus sp.]MDE6785213.1 class B sortase [Ruminococcus sp.]
MTGNNERNDSASSRAERIKAIRAAVNSQEEAENTAESSASSSRYARNNRADYRNSGMPHRNPPPGRRKKRKKKKTLRQKIRELFPEKGDNAAEIVRKFVFLTSIAAIVVCGYMIGDYYIDLWQNNMHNDQLSDIYGIYTPLRMSNEDEDDSGRYDEKYYTLLDGAQKLLDKNPDIVGFIRIPSKDGDPVIELPVVQAEDNSKYLNLSVLGRESRAGALFLDWRNHFDHVVDHRLVDKNSDNLVIYGHNMKDDSMFGSLRYYEQNDSYYEEHPIIQLNSNYEQYTYKIFAFFIVDVFDDTSTQYECWNKLDFADENDFYDFVNEAKKRTLRTNDVDVKYGDPILTLSTCNYLLNDRSRLIVMARRVRSGEDIYEGTLNSARNTNIKYPSLYYNTKTNEQYDENAPFIPYGPEDAVKEAKKKFAEAGNENTDQN